MFLRLFLIKSTIKNEILSNFKLGPNLTYLNLKLLESQILLVLKLLGRKSILCEIQLSLQTTKLKKN